MTTVGDAALKTQLDEPRTTYTAEAGDHLVRLLGEQLEIYQCIYELSGRQLQLIGSDQSDELVSLLGKRQAFGHRLGELANQIRPWLERWEQIDRKIDERQRAAINNVLDKIGKLKVAISEHDQTAGQCLSPVNAKTSQPKHHNELNTLLQINRVLTARRVYAEAAQEKGRVY